MVELYAQTMIEAWHEAIRHILQEGKIFTDDDGKECLEAMNLAITVEQPTSSIVGIKKMRSSKKWRYPSEEELKAIMLRKESASIYEYLYGQRIFAYNGVFNQIEDYIIPLLQKRPHTRRATISLINPERDFTPGALNVPALVLIRFRVVDGKLTVTAVIRTSGFFTGWPANLYQLFQLQEYVANKVRLPIGNISTFSMSAHLHSEQLADIEEILGKDVLEGITITS